MKLSKDEIIKKLAEAINNHCIRANITDISCIYCRSSEYDEINDRIILHESDCPVLLAEDVLKNEHNISELIMRWIDASKEDPKDKSHIYVWYKDENPKWTPGITQRYFENGKYWYDSSKRQQSGAIILAWCYIEPPDWIKWEK